MASPSDTIGGEPSRGHDKCPASWTPAANLANRSARAAAVPSPSRPPCRNGEESSLGHTDRHGTGSVAGSQDQLGFGGDGAFKIPLPLAPTTFSYHGRRQHPPPPTTAAYPPCFPWAPFAPHYYNRMASREVEGSSRRVANFVSPRWSAGLPLEQAILNPARPSIKFPPQSFERALAELERGAALVQAALRSRVASMPPLPSLEQAAKAFTQNPPSIQAPGPMPQRAAGWDVKKDEMTSRLARGPRRSRSSTRSRHRNPSYASPPPPQQDTSRGQWSWPAQVQEGSLRQGGLPSSPQPAANAVDAMDSLTEGLGSIGLGRFHPGSGGSSATIQEPAVVPMPICSASSKPVWVFCPSVSAAPPSNDGVRNVPTSSASSNWTRGTDLSLFLPRMSPHDRWLVYLAHHDMAALRGVDTAKYEPARLQAFLQWARQPIVTPCAMVQAAPIREHLHWLSDRDRMLVFVALYDPRRVHLIDELRFSELEGGRWVTLAWHAYFVDYNVPVADQMVWVQSLSRCCGPLLYKPTVMAGLTGPTEHIEHICAMPPYADMQQEELRWNLYKQYERPKTAADLLSSLRGERVERLLDNIHAKLRREKRMVEAYARRRQSSSVVTKSPPRPHQEAQGSHSAVSTVKPTGEASHKEPAAPAIAVSTAAQKNAPPSPAPAPSFARSVQAPSPEAPAVSTATGVAATNRAAASAVSAPLSTGKTSGEALQEKTMSVRPEKSHQAMSQKEEIMAAKGAKLVRFLAQHARDIGTDAREGAAHTLLRVFNNHQGMWELLLKDHGVPAEQHTDWLE